MSFAFPSSDSEAAYAKINLALQLIQRLPNGYHQLDSVVAFVNRGDILHATVTEDGRLSLTIEGEFAAGLSTQDNLVLRAAEILRQHADAASGVGLGATLRLEKQTPVGAGLGGGSADAAACLRLLNRMWRLNLSLPALAELAEPLGADVPACVFSSPLRMEGIGEALSPVPHIPAWHVVLVYPQIPLWTPEVYGAVQADEDFSGSLPPVPTYGASEAQWHAWLHASGNDLQRPAATLNPEILPVIAALSTQEQCVRARMSGSGSACFALFEAAVPAQQAAEKIQQAHPQWWVRLSQILR